MADILIRGVSMPPSCAVCRWNCDMLLSGDLNGFAEGAYTRHEACPLIALPEGHGRLIDANTVIEDWGFGTSCNTCKRDAYQCQYHQTMTVMDVCGMIEDAPTIVPAEKEDT